MIVVVVLTMTVVCPDGHLMRAGVIAVRVVVLVVKIAWAIRRRGHMASARHSIVHMAVFAILVHGSLRHDA
jgi:hypothetical protein